MVAMDVLFEIKKKSEKQNPKWNDVVNLAAHAAAVVIGSKSAI